MNLLTGCDVYLDDDDDEDEETIVQISGTWNFRCISWRELLSRGSSLIMLQIGTIKIRIRIYDRRSRISDTDDR